MTVTTIIAAVVIFSILIFVHELGHFMAARAFGIHVREFAIGMGPAIFKRRKGETDYSLRAIPMGGFCNLGEDESSDDEQSFTNKPWWARFIVLFAGGFMNVMLGFVVCIVLVLMDGGVVLPVVDTIMPESNAVNFIKPGDRIVSINGTKINIYADINFEMQQLKGEPISLEVKRTEQGKTVTLKETITPYTRVEDGEEYYFIGFTAKKQPLTFIGVLREGFFKTIWMIKLVLVSLKSLITGSVSVKEVSGPVGVVGEISKAASRGLYNLLFLFAFIAVNLGIFNLLPFAALDGGRILFVLIEGIRRKPIKPEYEGMVHFIGFALLITLMLFATYNDIMRLIFGR